MSDIDIITDDDDSVMDKDFLPNSESGKNLCCW